VPVKRPLSEDDLAQIKRIYVKQKLPLKEVAARFHVGDRRMSQILKDLGIKLRHTGGTKVKTCSCGKPAVYRGRCKFHAKCWIHDVGKRYDRREEINAMCERLTEVVRSRPDELVGIIGSRRRYRQEWNVVYFWQGARDRSPERLRKLGSVPERVNTRACRMLLKALQKARGDVRPSIDVDEYLWSTRESGGMAATG